MCAVAKERPSASTRMVARRARTAPRACTTATCPQRAWPTTTVKVLRDTPTLIVPLATASRPPGPAVQLKLDRPSLAPALLAMFRQALTSTFCLSIFWPSGHVSSASALPGIPHSPHLRKLAPSSTTSWFGRAPRSFLPGGFPHRSPSWVDRQTTRPRLASPCLVSSSPSPVLSFLRLLVRVAGRPHPTPPSAPSRTLPPVLFPISHYHTRVRVSFASLPESHLGLSFSPVFSLHLVAVLLGLRGAHQICPRRALLGSSGA